MDVSTFHPPGLASVAESKNPNVAEPSLMMAVTTTAESTTTLPAVTTTESASPSSGGSAQATERRLSAEKGAFDVAGDKAAAEAPLDAGPVPVEVIGATEEDLALLEAVLLPFHPVGQPRMDERGVAIVTFSSLKVAQLVVDNGLMDFKFQLKDHRTSEPTDSPSAQNLVAPMRTSSLMTTSPVDRTSSLMTTSYARGQRVNLAIPNKLSLDDPFYLLTDINISSPLLLAYCTFMIFFAAFCH